jgi:cytochrome c-type biogenesis protein CcmH
MPRLHTLAVAFVALALTIPAAALGSNAVVANPVQKTTLPDVEDEVMCPVCGTALNLSGGPQADREREFIRRQIAAGKTKDEIKAALVAQYGEEVLAEPPKSGFSLTAWLVPIAAILLALSAIVLGLRRWRRAGRGGDGPHDPDRPLDPSERERLDSDLARYDL